MINLGECLVRIKYDLTDPNMIFSKITYDKDLDEFRYIPTGDYVRLWDDRNVIYHEATRKCYQYHDVINSLMTVDVEHCSMGTRFLLCKDKVLRPKQNLTNVNKTNVSDTQFNQSQQEHPVDDIDDTRMTVLSPDMYGHHQFTAVEHQQMAYLKNQTRSQTFNEPQTQPFSDPIRRLNHISKRGPYIVQHNGPLPYHDQSEVAENYDQNPPDVENLSTRDAVSEMKRQLHFLDQ